MMKQYFGGFVLAQLKQNVTFKDVYNISNWIICVLHRQVFIDFDKFQTLNAAMSVQRLSFQPQGQTEDVGWYFRDDQLWREYGSQVRKISTLN